ncbi:MAG: type II toxin-antitoxin system CcdA family antitoxin [Alphaproteobacteria bacterium]
MGKERITVEIDAELMERLRAAGVDPQAYVQRLLDRKAAENPRQSDAEWAEANKEALDEYKAQVDRIGTFASRQRLRRRDAAV